MIEYNLYKSIAKISCAERLVHNMNSNNQNSFNETLKIKMEIDNAEKVEHIMKTVYEALKEKGYNPINQIVAYLISGDPTYITSYNNARILIGKVERDEILEEFTKSYLKTIN